MQEVAVGERLKVGKAPLGFVGAAIDERTRASVAFTDKHVDRLLDVHYNWESFELTVGGRQYFADRYLEAFDLNAEEELFLDSTSLGVVELFYLLKAAYLATTVQRVSVLYVEPGEYRQSPDSILNGGRDFELAEEIPGFKAFPVGAFHIRGDSRYRGAFLLGFEEGRLDRAFEENPGLEAKSAVSIFGVPAMSPGWESHSFSNNCRVLLERGLTTEPYYCGAEDPATTKSLLSKLYDTKSNGEKMYVAPLGTKPMSVGALLFAIEKGDVGLLYDHPRPKLAKSIGMHRWHLYEVEQFGT